MSLQRFSSGTRFRWKDITYEVLRLLPDKQVNIEDIFTGAVSIVEIPVLVQALFDGELRFTIEGRAAKNEAEDNAISTANEYLDLADCSEQLLIIARYRLEVIRPLLRMDKRTRKDVENRVKQVRNTRLDSNHMAHKNSVSVASVYRWLADYTKSGNDLRSLIPATDKRGGKGSRRLSPEIESMLKGVIEDRYYVRERVTIEDIRDELAVRVEKENHLRDKNRQLILPSRATLARRIGEISTYERLAAKQGSRVARQELSQYGQTDYPITPLERVEIDHTTSDLIVIDDRDNLPLGRLTLTYCLDMATRYPLGYYMGFEPPSYLSVMECLYHAICPKEDVRKKYGTEHQWSAYGVPAILMVDNAKEFIGRDLEDACLLLGIVVQQTPVRAPRFKAGIERMYGSLNTMLFHTLPGTTFSNMRERGDYDSSKQACVYLSDVDKMLNIFVVDIYAQRFHRGLQAIPARRWEELTQGEFAFALPPNAEELMILLGRTANRVIHHYGIEFVSLRYNCDDLAGLRTRLSGEKAKIKYHPSDLSHLYVYDPFDRYYIRVPALNEEYTQGLSLWKHRIIRQSILSEKDRVDHIALGQAKRKIQEMIEQGRERKRRSNRSRLARWDSNGKPTRQFVEQMKSVDDTDQGILQEKKKNEATHSSAISNKELSLPISIDDATDWEISYLPNLPGEISKSEGDKNG